MSMLARLWADEHGGTQSAEIVVIATILLIGIIPGLSTLRDGIVTELADLAAAVSNLFPTPTVIPSPTPPWACITIGTVTGPPEGGA